MKCEAEALPNCTWFRLKTTWYSGARLPFIPRLREPVPITQIEDVRFGNERFSFFSGNGIKQHQAQRT